MSGQLLVSVVLPTRDRGYCIERAIDSVLGQTHGRLELLVVDDGSRDDTASILARYGDRITVLRQQPSGAYVARNLGLERARGELVAFIDSDDVWHPHRLESQLPLLQRPEVGLVFGDVALVAPSGRRARQRARTSFELTPPRRGLVAAHFAWGNFIPMSSVLVRRASLEEIGGFPTSHPRSADYLTWFRIAANHEFDFVDHPVADYTVRRDGLSGDLGQSLRARLELFSAELAATSDPRLRRTLERLVFNQGMHLALAVVRRRARSVPDAWRVTRRSVAVGAAARRISWGARFAASQAVRRAKRLAA